MNNSNYNSNNQMQQDRNLMGSPNSAVNLIKTIGSSKKFLVAAILVTAGVLIMLCAAIIGTSQLESIFYLGGVNFGYYKLGLFLDIVISVVLSIGIWIIYTSCRSPKNGGISTSGLMMCKGTCIAYCIPSVIVSIMLSSLTVISLKQVFYNNFYDDSTYGGFNVLFYGPLFVFIYFLILALILGVLGGHIAYYMVLIKNINRIKATAMTGVADNRITFFILFWGWVAGVLGTLAGIIMFFISPVFGLGLLVKAVAYMFFTIIFLNYKAQMSRLISGYTTY